MKKIIGILLVTFLCNGNVFAQTDGGTNAWQTYMTPGDVHKMIAKYVGKWNEDVTFWMQPGAAPNTNKATAVNQMILGGRYQQSTVTGDMMGTKFEGFSLLGYDNAKKIFTSTWMDNFGTGTTTLEGTWDDATKTIIFKGKEYDPMTSKDMDVKETLQYVDDNTVKFQMFMIKDGAESKTMEINATRAK